MRNGRTETCPHCDTRVSVGPGRTPVRHIERAADAFDPRSFVIIGGDWLLHRCVIAADAIDEPSVGAR